MIFGARSASVCKRISFSRAVSTSTCRNRSGYRTEEYVSPFDGRSYRRQVLVEETGFEYDIVMQIFDARTGELLHNDNFKDFKQYEGESADPLVGMFQNLYSLEDRIVGIFAQKNVQATRVPVLGVTQTQGGPP